MVDHDSIPSRKWTSKLPVSHRIGHSVLAVDNEATDDVADIYNQAGDDYVSMPMAILRGHLPLTECTLTRIAVSGPYWSQN